MSKNVVVLESGKIVERFQVLTTGIVVYKVWEQTEFPYGHSTITRLDGIGGWLGQVTSRRVPADIDSLPAMTDERISAVRAWMAENEKESVDAIFEAFPHLLDRFLVQSETRARITSGEIEEYFESVSAAAAAVSG